MGANYKASRPSGGLSTRPRNEEDDPAIAKCRVPLSKKKSQRPARGVSPQVSGGRKAADSPTSASPISASPNGAPGGGFPSHRHRVARLPKHRARARELGPVAQSGAATRRARLLVPCVPCSSQPPHLAGIRLEI